MDDIAPNRRESQKTRTPPKRVSRRRGTAARQDLLRPSNPRRAGMRLVVASNRLPVVLTPKPGKGWSVEPAAGGLVTAMEPAMRRGGGVWVGWSGAPAVGQPELQRALGSELGERPYGMRAVRVEEAVHRRFYEGFSNQVLWPVLHGLPPSPAVDSLEWESYREVNRRFARALARIAGPNDLLWVHDYHLMLVADELRSLGMENRIVFFLHTPFPRLLELEKAPHHEALVRGLLSYDLVGFQTPRHESNFLEVVDAIGDRGVKGHRWASPKDRPERRRGRSGHFPISIDFEEFAEGAASSQVVERSTHLRRELNGRTLVLGVDRLDYTKGLPEKLHGFDRALHRFPELRGKVVLRQLVVPSREAVPAYVETKARVEELVSKINGEWGDGGWTPVDYRYERWEREELLAHYRIADAALVTPVNDGMNLVAKEFCAANGGSGVLILSAFAGAAGQLGHSALLVNPRDPESLAQAIRRACAMPAEERDARMTAARRSVRVSNVHRWVSSFLEAERRVTDPR